MARKKLTPMTGDPGIDAFAKMRNENLRKSRRKAPTHMNVVEMKLITQLLPIAGVGRVVCDSRQSAEYVKVRLRKFLAELGISEMIASSLQHNEVIVWRIAKYNMWRIKHPVEDTRIWKDAQAEEVTLHQQYRKGRRNDGDDLTFLKERIKDVGAVLEENPLAGVANLEMLRTILTNNLADNYITQEEYDAKMKEVTDEIERRKDNTEDES